MINNWEISENNAWKILGIPADADQEQIRRAYLQKVKLHAPDKDPEQFERIRDAYNALRDTKRRTRQSLLMVDPQAPFPSLLESSNSKRQFVNASLWWNVLKQKPRIGERDA